MKAFTKLFAALDETTRTSEKVEALARYFASAPASDAAWAVYFLTGHKPRQVIPSRKLWAWAIEVSGVPDWLFEESYHAVGDMAETAALLLPRHERSSDRSLTHWVEERLLPLRSMSETRQRAALREAWAELDDAQRFIWNKLITGSFRVGVSAQLVTRAFARAGGLPVETVAHRLMGSWQPTAEFYQRLLAAESADTDTSRPYPFFLAHPLEGEPASLGNPQDWHAEWKWDGIRAQLVRREGLTFLWTRGEELVTERYPEIAAAAAALPDGTVLDGEIVAWKQGAVLPFGQLQRRIGRKTLSNKLVAEVPVALMAFDLLEESGQDIRSRPLSERRARLEELLAAASREGLRISPRLAATTWEELAARRLESRSWQTEGVMIKRLDSPYRVGRVRGDWWKWKVHPHTMDAVLVYAQRGSGKRASLYTDYTFAVWDEGELVPIAKAYSGLTDAEIRQVDAFIRRHTVEKFGPVRTVKPELVFELGFESIRRSTRHRSGVAVRFPRILHWRKDKKPAEADTLRTLRALLPPEAERHEEARSGPRQRELFGELDPD